MMMVDELEKKKKENVFGFEIGALGNVYILPYKLPQIQNFGCQNLIMLRIKDIHSNIA